MYLVSSPMHFLEENILILYQFTIKRMLADKQPNDQLSQICFLNRLLAVSVIVSSMNFLPYFNK